MIWPRNIQAFLSLLEKQLLDLYLKEETRAIIRYFWDYSFEMPWEIAWEEEGDFSIDHYELAQHAAKRLVQGEPVQYVVGKAHFYGYDYFVNPSVLIPRPETEGLVLWIKEEWLKTSREKAPRLLDVGTGTGCIPITLGLELQKSGLAPSAFYGMDFSEEALEIARKNAQDKILLLSWIQRDIFEAEQEDFSELDVIVSNPPYVPQSEEIGMEMNVKEYEPERAIFVPDEDKLLFYRKIAELALHWLKPGGFLFFEIHYSQGEETARLLRDLGYKEVEVRQDLGGKDRMVKARR